MRHSRRRCNVVQRIFPLSFLFLLVLLGAGATHRGGGTSEQQRPPPTCPAAIRRPSVAFSDLFAPVTTTLSKEKHCPAISSFVHLHACSSFLFFLSSEPLFFCCLDLSLAATTRVIEVSEEELRRLLDKAFTPEYHLVQFYAPWCPFSAQMAPAYAAAARLFPSIPFLALNLDLYPYVAAELSLRGMPTVVLFKGGTAGARHVYQQNLSTFIRWIKDHTNTSPEPSFSSSLSSASPSALLHSASSTSDKYLSQFRKNDEGEEGERDIYLWLASIYLVGLVAHRFVLVVLARKSSLANRLRQ
ncbi:hypothetical protein QOT17_000998 [Balamuthia mandrillaris]